MILALDDEHVVGMITVIITVLSNRETPWIEDFVVLPDYQGMGIGKSLFQKAREFVASQTDAKIELMSPPNAKAAHRLYRSMGLEHWPGYLFVER